MGKILVDEDDLRSMITDAVNDVIDKITKKIAAKCAERSYNNEIFSGQEAWGSHCGTSGNNGTCGCDCADTYSSHEQDYYSYSCGRSSSCGSSYSSGSYSGGCGSSGGC